MSTTETTASPALSGWSGDSDYFTFREYQGYRPEAVLRVLRGEILGAVFRGMVSPETCERLTRAFWAHPACRTRDGDAPVRYLGAYHYHKTTEEYLDDCAQITAAVDEVVGGPDDPLTAFYAGIAGAMEAEGRPGIVRTAGQGGRHACRGVLRSWFGRGRYALDPHEDRGQCREPRQAGFEIQRVTDRQVVAMNICLENGAGGGRLGVWNLQPDDASKRVLGTEFSGWPYPLQPLDAVEVTWLEIGAGDVYVFNGSHIHAVEPSVSPTERRTTLSGLLGFIDDTTVVSWT